MHHSLAESARAALNSALQRDIITGAVVAASDGESSIVMTEGIAPNDPAASFDADYAPRIGCLLKPFVATIVHQLEEEGALKLDDSVCRYLGELELGPALSSPISLIHLMSHTGGLTDHALQPTAARCGRDALSMVKELGPLQVYCLPGEFASYSNVGYLMLEAVIEKVCDKALLEVLIDRILSPLEIARTGAGFDNSSKTVLDLGLRMTCTEIFRFVGEFTSGRARDRTGAPGLLREDTVEKMLRFRATLPGLSQLYDSWSAGWARFGAETFGHNAISPDDDARIVVRFSSRACKVIVIVARTRRVLSLLGNLCPAILQLENPGLHSIGALQEGALDSTLAGTYWLHGGRVLRLWQHGGALQGSLTAGPEAEAETVTLMTTSKSFLYVAGDGGTPLGLFSFVRSRTGCVFLWDGESLHPRVGAVP